MKRLSDTDVKKALTLLERTIANNGNEPTLLPEQVDRILSANQETDPSAKLAKMTKVADSLLQEANVTKESYEKLLGDLGIAYDRFEAMFENDRSVAGPLQKAAPALEESLQNMERDLKLEIASVLLQNASAIRPKELPSVQQQWV